MNKTITLAIVILVALLGFLYLTSRATPTPAPVATVTVTSTPTEREPVVTLPVAGSVVKSPLVVTGQIPGNWVFEATMGIKIVDANGKVLGSIGGHTQGDWMTEKLVPFSGTITFTKPTTSTGTLIITNDNPSGMPEHDRKFEVPIRF